MNEVNLTKHCEHVHVWFNVQCTFSILVVSRTHLGCLDILSLVLKSYFFLNKNKTCHLWTIIIVNCVKLYNRSLITIFLLMIALESSLDYLLKSQKIVTSVEWKDRFSWLIDKEMCQDIERNLFWYVEHFHSATCITTVLKKNSNIFQFYFIIYHIFYQISHRSHHL